MGLAIFLFVSLSLSNRKVTNMSDLKHEPLSRKMATFNAENYDGNEDDEVRFFMKIDFRLF